MKSENAVEVKNITKKVQNILGQRLYIKGKDFIPKKKNV